MLVLNIAITLPVYEVQIIQILCLWLTPQTHVNHITNVFLIKKKIEKEKKRVKWSASPPKHQHGQRISIHIYTKLFKRTVLSSPYLKSLNKLLKSLSHFEEEAAAELQFPLFLCFLQSLVRLLAQIKRYFLFHNHFLTYSLLQFFFLVHILCYIFFFFRF